MKGKHALIGVGSLVGVLVLAFGLQMLGLQWTKFFKPKLANVEREAYEEAKPYVHGAIADIASYYEQYQNAETSTDKEIIQNVLKARFAEFDASNIKVDAIKEFFIRMRGY